MFQHEVQVSTQADIAAYSLVGYGGLADTYDAYIIGQNIEYVNGGRTLIWHDAILYLVLRQR